MANDYQAMTPKTCLSNLSRQRANPFITIKEAEMDYTKIMADPVVSKIMEYQDRLKTGHEKIDNAWAILETIRAIRIEQIKDDPVPDLYEAVRELINRDDYGSIRLPTQARDILVKALAKVEK